MKAPPKSSPKGRTLARNAPPRGRGWGWVIFAFAFLLYANTLRHGYVLDDDVVYLKNRNVQAGTGGIKDILTHSFTYGFTGLNDQYQSYRPVILIFFALEKQFFGNQPHTGHFINVLLFALSCLLLYRLMKSLFASATHPLSPGRAGKYLPLAITLLFAAHPIHTEAVANIKGRDDILNFIFFILSIQCVLSYCAPPPLLRQSASRRRGGENGGRRYLFLSAFFFFLALLCKEMAVTFLAIIPMTVFFFRNISIKKIIIISLPFIAAFGIYLLIRSSILDSVTHSEKMKVVNNALAAATHEPDRIATALLILGKYILLLLYPHPLSWDYSFNQIPIVGFSDWKVITTLLVFILLVGYALFVLFGLIKQPEYRIQKTGSVIYAYCILFFFITMSVVSNLFIMIGSTLGERFLFIPSIAFCLAAPYFLSRFGERILLAGIGVLVILFSFKTVDRNKDWKDNVSLFASGVEATPNSSRAQSAFGSSYREMGEKEPDPGKRVEFFKKAIVYYQKAIEILPENTEALYNAGVCYYGMGDKENALKVYEQALNVTPEYTNAANNAGVIYFERKEYENAKKYFLQAVKYDPNNSDALGNLGAIHHNQGNMKEAVEFYKSSLAVNPNNQNVRANLAKAEGALSEKK